MVAKQLDLLGIREGTMNGAILEFDQATRVKQLNAHGASDDPEYSRVGFPMQ